MLIGGTERAKVNANGEFELESSLPDDLEGLVHLELKFEPTNQNEEIKNHYLEKLSGSFVRNYTESDETYQKASFQHSVTIDDGQQTFVITEPNWKTPADYGEPIVWIETKLEKQGDYVVVK
ncbi:hypothetical protein CV093_17150 [Oceanobacillus sp. 143]|nr:hypothetical protein CV093_17150 [Oceanobacillus sp. 143]